MMGMRAPLTITLLALCAFPAAAEEGPAVEDITGREVIPTIMNCTYVTTCDQAGLCNPNNDRIVFEVTAVDVRFHGEGRYLLRYGDVLTDAILSDPYSPLRWLGDGDELFNSLTGLGGGHMLWVQGNNFNPEEAQSTVHFLNCEEPA
jgi:hypothetical protein